MKVYLAAAYARKEEMRQRREELQAAGFTVVSSWLDVLLFPAEPGTRNPEPGNLETGHRETEDWKPERVTRNG